MVVIVSQLQTLSPSAVKALPPARKLLCQANPIIRYAKPYTPDILALITEFGSASNTFDAIGHTLMMDPVVNEDAYVSQTPDMAKALQTLVDSGLLRMSSRLSYDPYPAPGQAIPSPPPDRRSPVRGR